MGLNLNKQDKSKKRPDYNEAINAIYVAYFELKQTLERLEEIFRRENNYRIAKDFDTDKKTLNDKD
jgi:hypothetical protein